MLFVCYGMVKSASTFTFQLATRIAQTQSDQEEIRRSLPEHLSKRFISNNLTSTLEEISNYLPNQSDIYVVKTHSPLDLGTQEMLSKGKIKATVSYRDPYDIVVSLKDAGEIERQKEVRQQRPYFCDIKSYEDALKKLPNVIQTARTWLDYEDILRVPFSSIANQPVVVGALMAKYMGINLDSQEISKIVEYYTSNKKLIFEFNVGIEGRGNKDLNFKELNLSDKERIKKIMDDFISDYLK